MILTAILNLIYNFINLLLYPITLLGDVSLPSSISTSINTASGYFHAINNIVPVDTMITILGVSLAFESAYLIFKVIMWILAKIPTIN